MKKAPKHTSAGAIAGMCLGMAVACGLSLCFRGLGMGFSLIAGLILGASAGTARDLRINRAIEEKAYSVLSFERFRKTYAVTLADKNGIESVVTVPRIAFEKEHIKKGDLVYLEESDGAEKAPDGKKADNSEKKK